MIHTNLPRNCVVFLLLCELTRSAIYGSQKCDSHKWLTALVDEVKGKLRIFEACLCGSLYSTLTTSFYPYAFYNKRQQTLFKDQLDRSNATCSFKEVKVRGERMIMVILYIVSLFLHGCMALIVKSVFFYSKWLVLYLNVYFIAYLCRVYIKISDQVDKIICLVSFRSQARERCLLHNNLITLISNWPNYFH